MIWENQERVKKNNNNNRKLLRLAGRFLEKMTFN
jgi:hypothetical protein